MVDKPHPHQNIHVYFSSAATPNSNLKFDNENETTILDNSAYCSLGAVATNLVFDSRRAPRYNQITSAPYLGNFRVKCKRISRRFFSHGFWLCAVHCYEVADIIISMIRYRIVTIIRINVLSLKSTK